MALRRNYYKCEECGNIVSVLDAGHGTLKCCGEPMVLLVPSNGPEGQEKHVPVVTELEGKVEVVVGSTEHPMLAEHYIEWIELATATTSCRQFLSPGEAPRATFQIRTGEDYLITIYCNVHGLWDNLSGTADADDKRKLIIKA